jgi:chaperonin cofactor prefoldin
MAGPTTEAVNEDVKELREDLHKTELALTKEIEGAKKEIAVVGDRVKGILTSIRLVAGLAITSIVASVGWGASLASDMKSLEKRFDKLEVVVDARFDKLESSIATRFDKLEASIAKLIEQNNPAVKAKP